MPDSPPPIVTSEPPCPKNFGRRAIGLVVCLAPPAVLTVSLIAGLAGKGTAPFAGIWFVVPAALLAVLNLYLSFVRGFLFSRRRGSPEGYRRVSGISLVGSLLVMVGGILGFGAIGTAVSG